MTPALAEVLEGKRKGKCAVCGESFLHPATGRKRILCRKKTCERARYRAQRRSYGALRPYVWTAADLMESLAAWGFRCAVCRGALTARWTVFAELVPCHVECCPPIPAPPQIQAWLSRVVPGCPLPKVGP